MGSSVAPADSKGALVMMTKNLARGLGPKIRVNAARKRRIFKPKPRAKPIDVDR
jgi:NAD(P)-dependent dehydrogenase (short-subunit alcohol dehydrogenase family)